MAVWVSRSSSFEEEAEADAQFWKELTPDERVSILENMREERLEEHGQSDERLRRVARRLPSA